MIKQHLAFDNLNSLAMANKSSLVGLPSPQYAHFMIKSIMGSVTPSRMALKDKACTLFQPSLSNRLRAKSLSKSGASFVSPYVSQYLIGEQRIEVFQHPNRIRHSDERG